ncbi:MAG: GNAT family N-acetyltransferase, partial [Phycisphaerales bacterium]
FTGPLDPAELDAVEAMCAERAIPVQLELSSLADASIAPMLTDRAYRLVGFENVLGMALPADRAPRPAPGVAVEICADDRAADWLDAVVTGFASPDAEGVPSHESFPRDIIEAAIADMAGAAGLSRYIATLDGVLAGGASMRTCDGVAHLCGAATLPASRRRGVQTALLHQRLADAADAGCDLAVVTTQPGSPSQRNAQARGFEPLYVRAVLVRTP